MSNDKVTLRQVLNMAKPGSGWFSYMLTISLITAACLFGKDVMSGPSHMLALWALSTVGAVGWALVWFASLLFSSVNNALKDLRKVMNEA